MIKIVGIGEYVVSNNEEDIIKTFALGSCVAVTIYCPIKKVLGMVHIALSNSNISNNQEKELSGYYADIAVPLLINKVCTEYGGNRNNLIVFLFGGAESNFSGDVFNIGRRNLDTIKNILDQYNIRYNYENTGGNVSRTVEMDVITGSFKVYEQPMKI